MSTLKELIEANQITAQVNGNATLAYEKLDKWQREANGYSVTMINGANRRRLTLNFWQGYGIKNLPTAYDVLNCLITEASCIAYTEDDFIREFGYSERKGLSIYKGIIKQTEKLKRFLDQDYDKFLNLDPNDL